MAIDWTRVIAVSDEDTVNLICGKEILYVRGLAAGRGIVSVDKTGEDGITSFFTITYNDGTTSTFSIKTADTFDYSVIAPEFDPTASYQRGDVVTYNDKLYRFTQDHSGPWVPNHVEEIALVDLIEHSTFDYSIIAPEFDEMEYYQAGDAVIYEDAMYKFKRDHIGSWNPNHVIQYNLLTDLFEPVNTTVAEDFDRTKQYHFGDFAIYNGKLYMFQQDHIGPFLLADVQETLIVDRFVNWIEFNHATALFMRGENFCEFFETDKIYHAGDYVWKTNTNTIYRFLVDHDAGEWDDSEVEEITNISTEFVDYPHLNEATQAIRNTIAPEFDPTTAYSKGDCVFYAGRLYTFLFDHAAGAFNFHEVSITSIDNSFVDKEELKQSILRREYIAPDFDPTASYVKDDYVIFDGRLYQFSQNYSGAWPYDNTITVPQVITQHFVDFYDLQDTLQLFIESGAIAPRFNPATAYDYGALVTYNSKLYSFVRSHTGAWSDNDVQECTVSQTFLRASNIWGKIDSVAIAPDFDAETAYEIGDYVTYIGRLYIFRSNHSAGAWNPNHVEEISVMERVTYNFESIRVLWNDWVHRTNIAPVFDSTASYSIGDYVFYGDKLYNFIHNHTGAWSASDVVEKPVTDDLKFLDAQIWEKADYEDIAPDFSASVSYNIGDYVNYNGNIYRFISAHTAGAWNASHVILVSVMSELKTKITDAPSDGNTYGRKNGAWTEIEVGGLETVTFYVNPFDGSDSNVGDEDHPFKSLSKAVDSVPENGNGVIYLKYPTFNFYDEPVIQNKKIKFICTNNQDLMLIYPIDIVIENSHVEFHGYSTSYDFALYRGMNIKNSEVIIDNFRRVYFETSAGVEASAEIKLQSSQLIAECPMYIKEIQEGSHITAIKALDGSVVSMNALTFVPANSSNCTLFHADGSLFFCQSLADALFDDCITTNGGRILWGQQVISYGQAEIDAMLADKADVITNTASGNPAIIEDGADGISVADLTVAIDHVQSGSGDPSPTNIRPIIGWTGVTITQIKNLWKSENYKEIFVNPDTGKLQANSKSRMIYVSVEAGKTYTIEKNLSSRFIVAYSTTVTTGADYITDSNWRDDDATSYTSTAPAGAKYLCATVVNTNYDNQNTVFQSVRVYEAGQKNTIVKSWQTEAGTVYGGSLNGKTGVLTVTHGQIASYDGETLPGAWISDRDVYAEGTTPTIGAQVVYELATPTTYQLASIEISTFLGNNTISADTGNVTLLYRADTKTYITEASRDSNAITQSMITQTTEARSVASQNYSKGDLFILNNQLMRATANITANGNITVGTSGNAEVIDLATVISELSARISALES